MNANVIRPREGQLIQVTDARFSNAELIFSILVAALLLPTPYPVLSFQFLLAISFGYSIIVLFPILVVIAVLLNALVFLKRKYSHFLVYVSIALFGFLPIINSYLVIETYQFGFNSINSIFDIPLGFPLNFLFVFSEIDVYKIYSYFFAFFLYVCAVLWFLFIKILGVPQTAANKILKALMLISASMCVITYFISAFLF